MMYTFTKPFELETQGEKHEITYIDIKEPSEKDYSDMSRLKSFIGRVSLKSAEMSKLVSDGDKSGSKKQSEENEEKEESIQDKVDTILMLIETSGADASDAFVAVKNMLKSSNAKMNGEFPCTGGNIMPFYALNELLGAYIVNFTIVFSSATRS